MDKFINKIFLTDTIELMKELPDESVDMVLTDPPYGMDYQSGRRKEQFDEIQGDSGEDFDKLLKTYIAECYRIMKPDTTLYMFCSWHKVGFFQEELEKYFNLKNLIVWEKNNHGAGDLEGGYAPKHELIWFAAKGNPKRQGKRRYEDVIQTAKMDTTKSKHPTPKPIKLLKKFIETSSKPGDIIFDGFMGVGSTAIAACKFEDEERRFIGAEIEPKYYEVATTELKKLWINAKPE